MQGAQHTARRCGMHHLIRAPSSLTVTPPRFLRDIPLYHPQGFELVFYGDSITETWRGTDLGRPCKRPGCPEGACHLPVSISVTGGGPASWESQVQLKL